MRIGGGSLRGRTVRAPRGRAVRPTSGRLKKALFDILAPRLPGARMLDLFAGAGAVGCEALSRGAAHVVFVERNRSAIEAIRKNLEALGLSERATLLPKEAKRAIAELAARGEVFDLVFLDPPYRAAVREVLLAKVAPAGLLAPEGLLVVEHHHKSALPELSAGLARTRQVRAGESCLSFFQLVLR